MFYWLGLVLLSLNDIGIFSVVVIVLLFWSVGLKVYCFVVVMEVVLNMLAGVDVNIWMLLVLFCVFIFICSSILFDMFCLNVLCGYCGVVIFFGLVFICIGVVLVFCLVYVILLSFMYNFIISICLDNYGNVFCLCCFSMVICFFNMGWLCQWYVIGVIGWVNCVFNSVLV